jgi:hypothetical protein
MALSSGALTTVAKLLSYMGGGSSSSDVLLPGLKVYHDAGTASTAATARVTDTQWIGTITGGANAGTDPFTFSAITDDTMVELVARINALAKGYVATLMGGDSINTTWLVTHPTTDIWGVAKEITLYYVDYDLVERLIEAASDQVETWMDRKFASQDFSETGIYSRSNGIVRLQNPHVTGIDFFSIELEDGLTVKYTGTDPVATVEVRADSVVYRSRASDTATETEEDLTAAANDTITELAAEINLIAGWAATVRNTGPSQYLKLKPAENAANREVTLEAWVPYDDDYILHAEEGLLEIGSAFHGFTSSPAQYRCDYTAGYATVPYDVEQVVIELAAEMFTAAGKDTNLKSEKLGDYAYTLASASERKGQWMERLAMHRKMVI